MNDKPMNDEQIQPDVLWVANVMKENLEVEGNIPDVVFTVATDQKQAIENVRTNIRSTAYWKEGKSFIRIRSIFPLLVESDGGIQLIRTRDLSSRILDSDWLSSKGVPNPLNISAIPKEGITSNIKRSRRRRTSK